jgi:hypothetical protein
VGRYGLRDVYSRLILCPSLGEAVDEAAPPAAPPCPGSSWSPADNHLPEVAADSGGRLAVGDLPDEPVLVTTTDGFGGSDGADLPGTVRTRDISSSDDLTGLGTVMDKYRER